MTKSWVSGILFSEHMLSSPQETITRDLMNGKTETLVVQSGPGRTQPPFLCSLPLTGGGQHGRFRKKGAQLLKERDLLSTPLEEHTEWRRSGCEEMGRFRVRTAAASKHHLPMQARGSWKLAPVTGADWELRDQLATAPRLNLPATDSTP